jgi:heme exporter protein A
LSSRLDNLAANSPNSAPLCLSGRDLFCERDDRVLFNELNFDFSAGQIIQIAGPNGSGKSTLMRILLGMSAGFEGTMTWNGQNLDKVRYDFNGQLLYLGHQVGIKGNLSPEENLKALNPKVSQFDIYNALDKVGLRGFEDLPCQGLSAGQQRRVALARLFIETKSVWILDEPFTAIDKNGVAELEAIIVEHAANGGLVILTTHHEIAANVTTLMLGNKAVLNKNSEDEAS